MGTACNEYLTVKRKPEPFADTAPLGFRNDLQGIELGVSDDAYFL